MLITKTDEIAISILCTACHPILHEVRFRSTLPPSSGHYVDFNVRKPSARLASHEAEADARHMLLQDSLLLGALAVQVIGGLCWVGQSRWAA